MRNSKKLLSFFLAVVMVLSVFTVMASAYTIGGAEGASDVDFKYTVEKVDVLPETEAGSVELAGDNFYAVTLWMKSAKPIDTIIAPFHYNKTLFAPITLSDGEVTYPTGAGLDPDTYCTDMGDGTNYLYTLGDYMNNTGMYTAAGATTTNKALAKCIGLGNANAAAIKVQTEFVSLDHANYAKWSANLPADTGIVFAKVDVATNAKTAYLNTIEGITTNADWNRMFTVYFEAIADDVAGAEFGVFADTAFGPDACYDANGKGYYESATKYDPRVPTINYVSNAVVEEAAAPSPVVAKSSQIRFNNGLESDANFSFDVRTRAAMTAADFAAICGDDATAVNAIESVGFVYADSSVGLTVADAKAAATGASVDGAVVVEVEHIQKTGTEYVWTCLLTDADKADAVDAVGYITVGGKTYLFDAVSSTDFGDLYDTWYSQYAATLS